jgi:hypothetical protein
MNDELVTIATFDNTVQANLVRNQLAAAGIRATLVDEHTVGMNWMLSNAIGGVKLIVREEDYDDAAKILADPGADQAPDDAGQTFLGPVDAEQDENDVTQDEAEEALAESPDKTELAPTQREQDAERAFRAAFIGILLQPLQFYAAWLLLSVWLSHERLAPEYRRKAWRALAISGPFLFLWLLMIKIMFFSGYYYTDYEYWEYYDLE